MADEQWDLMSVKAIGSTDGRWDLTVGESPDFQWIPREPDLTGRGDQGLKLVSSLGQQGWQLVSVDTVHRLDHARERTYWLKRRVG